MSYPLLEGAAFADSSARKNGGAVAERLCWPAEFSRIGNGEDRKAMDRAERMFSRGGAETAEDGGRKWNRSAVRQTTLMDADPVRQDVENLELMDSGTERYGAAVD